MVFGALGLLLVIIAVGGYMAYRYPTLSAPLEHAGLPVCGRCGYPSRGVETLACPECGADLREVGILPPGVRRRRGFGRFIPWSLAVLIVGGIAIPITSHFLNPIVSNLKETRTFTFNTNPVLSSVVLEKIYSRWHPAWHTGKVVKVEIPIQAEMILANGQLLRPDLRPTATGWEVNQTSITDHQSLTKWLTRATGVPEDQTRLIAPELMAELNLFRSSEYLIKKNDRSTHSHGNRRHGGVISFANYDRNDDSGPALPLALLLTCVAMTIWMVGIHKIRDRPKTV